MVTAALHCEWLFDTNPVAENFTSLASSFSYRICHQKGKSSKAAWGAPLSSLASKDSDLSNSMKESWYVPFPWEYVQKRSHRFLLFYKHTTDSEEPKWVKMQSITQENDLEAFLTTAALAGTEFTAGE